MSSLTDIDKRYLENAQRLRDVLRTRLLGFETQEGSGP